MNKKILIVEDEKDLAEIMKKSLVEENFSVEMVHEGGMAMEVFYHFNPDLVLLDINLPKKNGWEICREIRKISTVPIIIMTARDGELDEIQGLELGADDYVTKPFSLKVMVLKVKKILKVQGENIFKLEDMTLDFNSFTLEIESEKIELSKREIQLLEYLIKNKGMVLARENILNEVWGYEFFGEERAVDTLVTRVRKKLGKYGDHIKSVRGVGYVFQEKES
ncbi:MAG: response regulator transcription factor [Fusobacteriaceae bacterium]